MRIDHHAYIQVPCFFSLQIQDGLKKMYPMGRIGEVKDVASSIVFLASDNASFVHGVVLPIDGGKVLTSKPARDDKAQS